MAPGAVIHDSKSVTIRFEISLGPLGYGWHVLVRPVSISFGSNMAPGAMDDTHTHTLHEVCQSVLKITWPLRPELSRIFEDMYQLVLEITWAPEAGDDTHFQKYRILSTC